MRREGLRVNKRYTYMVKQSGHGSREVSRSEALVGQSKMCMMQGAVFYLSSMVCTCDIREICSIGSTKCTSSVMCLVRP